MLEYSYNLCLCLFWLLQSVEIGAIFNVAVAIQLEILAVHMSKFETVNKLKIAELRKRLHRCNHSFPTMTYFMIILHTNKQRGSQAPFSFTRMQAKTSLISIDSTIHKRVILQNFGQNAEKNIKISQHCAYFWEQLKASHMALKQDHCSMLSL